MNNFTSPRQLDAMERLEAEIADRDLASALAAIEDEAEEVDRELASALAAIDEQEIREMYGSHRHASPSREGRGRSRSRSRDRSRGAGAGASASAGSAGIGVECVICHKLMTTKSKRKVLPCGNTVCMCFTKPVSIGGFARRGRAR